MYASGLSSMTWHPARSWEPTLSEKGEEGGEEEGTVREIQSSLSLPGIGTSTPAIGISGTPADEAIERAATAGRGVKEGFRN